MNSIILTTKEIYNLAVFAGLVIDDDLSKEIYEENAQIVIGDSIKIKYDDGRHEVHLSAYFADYPDDGAVSIESEEK